MENVSRYLQIFWERISIFSISLVKYEQIVRGSLLHNLILVRTFGFETINVAKTNVSWKHYSSVWTLFFIHDLSFSAPRLLSNAECAFLIPVLCRNSIVNSPHTHPLNLTCHHLKVSSERALFSLVIRGWMDWLKRSANHGSSSSSAMHWRQAHSPLEKKLSDRRNAYLKK